MRTQVVPLLSLLLLAGCPTTEPPPEPPAEAPVAPLVEPTALEVERFMGGFLANRSVDVIRSALEDGSFVLPEEPGYDGNNTRWEAIAPGDNGSSGSYSPSFYYVFADLVEPLAAGQRLIARSSGTVGTHIGPHMQPGYFYGDRRPRVPLIVPGDGAAVGVRALGYRNIELQLWSTTDEVWLNLSDTTAPELPVGDTSEAWLGVPLLNLTERALTGGVARVIENDHFEATEQALDPLGPAATTQVPFLLRPKVTPEDPEGTLTAVLRVVVPGLDFSYERELEIGIADPDEGHWMTLRSPIDGSVQGFGVRRPADFDPEAEYALVLSLHGASVQARGQARSYEQRDWAYIVAPTNRHPFGFDWEEWGRFNALATLDHAMDRFTIDPTRVYLTGHSMGGHGTWHVGTSTPGRFATLGPSAGWESFYTYGGSARPTGAFARARAHSDTLVYMENLARRGAYVIHGDADDNVPVSEGRNLFAAVSEVTADAVYHEEPGVGHWWDLDGEDEGADCVDWDPLFDFMQERTLDPHELEFSFRSSSPGYSPHHSFVTLGSAADAYSDVIVQSALDGDTLDVTTSNVRSMSLDGAALLAQGVSALRVDGEAVALEEGPLQVGPQSGKRHDAYGPLNQVFRRPFCFVYEDGDEDAWRYGAFLTSYWAVLGNGHACGVPASAVTDDLRARRNLVWLGVSPDVVGAPDEMDWSGDQVSVGGQSWGSAGMLFVFPQGESLGAVITTTDDSPGLQYSIIPFSSRGGMPDYLVWSRSGGLSSGFFTPEWGL